MKLLSTQLSEFYFYCLLFRLNVYFARHDEDNNNMPNNRTQGRWTLVSRFMYAVKWACKTIIPRFPEDKSTSGSMCIKMSVSWE